jgi:hypothetical protein
MLVPRFSEIFLIVNSLIYDFSIDKSSIDSKFKVFFLGCMLVAYFLNLLFVKKLI